jgi:hypothetical protein
MNNNCINLKQKLDRSLYCKINKCSITLKDCNNCKFKEYKAIRNKPIKGKKHKLTKATEIPKSVKKKVWERDNHKCIFCHEEVPWNLANSHFVKRSHNGLGIEQDVFTACIKCHQKFDDSIDRESMKIIAYNHLCEFYKDLDEKDLVYKKYDIKK